MSVVPFGSNVNPYLIKIPQLTIKVNEDGTLHWQDLQNLFQHIATTTPSYVEGKFTGTLTGMTAAVTGEFDYRIIGNLVFVTVYGSAGSVLVSGTSNSLSFTTTGAPSILTPKIDTVVTNIWFADNGSPILTSAFLVIKASGGTWNCNKSSGAWTASGQKGIYFQSFFYPLM